MMTTSMVWVTCDLCRYVLERASWLRYCLFEPKGMDMIWDTLCRGAGLVAWNVHIALLCNFLS